MQADRDRLRRLNRRERGQARAVTGILYRMAVNVAGVRDRLQVWSRWLFVRRVRWSPGYGVSDWWLVARAGVFALLFPAVLVVMWTSGQGEVTPRDVGIVFVGCAVLWFMLTEPRDPPNKDVEPTSE